MENIIVTVLLYYGRKIKEYYFSYDFFFSCHPLKKSKGRNKKFRLIYASAKIETFYFCQKHGGEK